ncbi:hypothetical protein Q3V94_01175 [Caloramator sp. CAR-1]|uniref:hypothetical protein n=1 Tax=Caloramator sp. CAR-1 TaxID=3062777 RepID=UPI0026E3B79C|nr:hypothetical protein [Caloramator sp. CAR-1]MDO6353697.1 hypothetical protein [Caloramator sp. CAR-1]
MKKIRLFINDALKAMGIGFAISLIILSISWAICFIVYKGNTFLVFNGVKNSLYYIGILILFLSAAFFIQRDATRPLNYEDEWKKHFKVLNLGFVILFIGIAINVAGMVIQNIIEK